MTASTLTVPPELFVEDETGWLEMTAQLVAEGRFQELDWDNLREYLSDMARRDRREAANRLLVLLVHLLKWKAQPDHRSRSWELTIFRQRAELRDLLESRTLRNHVEEILAQRFNRAIKEASLETGLPESSFPSTLTRSLDELLRDGDNGI